MPLRAPPGPASAKCCVFQSSLLGVAGARPAGTIRNLQGVWPEGRMPGGRPGFPGSSAAIARAGTYTAGVSKITPSGSSCY